MNKMNKISKVLGGLLITVLLLASAPLTGTAHAAAVTINVTGITNHLSAALPVGAYVQIIRSADASAGAPGSDGLPAGDTVVGTGTITPAGTFSGAASITASNYVYIRVWETWNGTGSPAAGTYYGTGAVENVGTGFIYTYDPAGFATSQRLAPTITKSVTTLSPSATQGSNASSQTFTVGNSGTAALNYTISKTQTWIASVAPASGAIAVGGANQTITVTYNTSALAAGTYNDTITITDANATNNPQTIAVTLTVNPPAAFNYTLGVAPASGTVQQGNSTTPVVTATLTSGTTTSVALSATGQPAGVTVSFAPTSISPTASSNMTIAVGGAVPVGTYPITITGVGGSVTRTATYNLTVSSTPVVTPSITSIVVKDTTTTSGYVYDTIDILGSNFGGSGSSSAPAGSTVELMSQGGSYVTLPDSGTSDIVFWWDAGKIQVLVPHLVGTTYTVAGTATIRVTTPSGSGTGTFTIKPRVYSVTPNTGSVGTSVAITGTGFHGTAASNSVSFNGTSAAASALAQTSSNETLTVAVPTGATTGQLLVTVNSQSSNTNYDWAPYGQVVFTVAGTVSPRVTGIAPAAGEQGMTMDVTISGADVTWSGDMVSAVHFSNPGITVNSATGSGTGISANITIATSAATGDAAVTVDGASGSATFAVSTAGSAPIIVSISPSAGPAGTRVNVTGVRFGAVQASSYLAFQNIVSNVSYNAEIVSWSDSLIVAVIPRLAAAGTYEVKATRVAVVAGAVTAQESNTTGFQVTSAVAGGDIATIYPNPFNPNAQVVTIAVSNPTGATNLGVYIFDMTAHQVAKQALSGTNQTTWDGKDLNGALVGDGAYILRVINEDTKTLIARGKILVVKQ